MSSSYDLWLTDDAGCRMVLLKPSFFSYSRTTRGLGTFEIGFPYHDYKKLVPDLFRPDWRVDVWRSPGNGFQKRRDASYLLRKFNIYQRVDGVNMITMLGRSPVDILKRMTVVLADSSLAFPPDTTRYTKTDYADDMMKEIVTQNFTPNFGPIPYVNYGSGDVATGEWAVDPDQSLGPSVTMSFYGRNILEVLEDIQSSTFALNRASSSNRKIYFDVVEGAGLPGGFGYIFRTFADMRGQDRTGFGLIFSPENGNLKEPVYYEDYLDQITSAGVTNLRAGGANAVITDATARYLSRWNFIRKEENGSTVYNENLARAYQILDENKGIKSINCTFLNTPGGPAQPRSLYGVDWDLGDLVSVQFADKLLTAEVKIVYVAVDEDGNETITGRNEVGS